MWSTESAFADEPTAERKIGPRRSVTSRTISPSYVVFQRDSFEIALGGLVKLHALPWAARGASLEDGDLGDEAGFLVRDAVLGLRATLVSKLELLITANLIESDLEVKGLIADAQLAYEATDAFAVTVGTLVPPFSRSSLTSAKRLPTVERPFVVNELRPSRRLGLMAEGSPFGGRVTYILGLMNGTPGYVNGNEDGGAMVGMRLEANVLGEPDPNDQGRSGLTLGADAIRSWNTKRPETGVSFDLLATYSRFSLVLEGLWHRAEEERRLERLGGYAELGSSFSPGADLRLQIIARGELFHADGSNGTRADDVLLLTTGVNVDLPDDHLRFQAQLTYRMPRYDTDPALGSAALAIRASF